MPDSLPKTDVCLVTMPYDTLSRPSMALSLLKAILVTDGIDVSVAYANMWFAGIVGVHSYLMCSSHISNVFLSGEWTFAEAAFGDDPRREEKDAEYLRQVFEAQGPLMQISEVQDPVSDRTKAGQRSQAESLISNLWAIRDAATRFVDEAAQRVLATGARVVGCTSTFEQHVASLALLRRIRELDPSVVTMLGGANCETDMGATTHRCFPWVDYLVSGEADGIIAGLCRGALEQGRDIAPGDLPPGVLGPGHRAAEAAGGKRPRLPRALFSDLDSLPVPRFEDYFATLEESPLRAHVRPGLPVETSRGCWWGAVHQCTFCGLNGTGMSYRSKSPDRVLAELNELDDRYGISDFEAVDNILDMAYHKTLLPALAADSRSRRLFYEIKANVTRAKLEEMVRAGVVWVQPGIENLHSEVLRLMDKGVQGWHNIQLLKWVRELGLQLYWSMLWGFPGEKDDWYAEMAPWFPALEHLPPPYAMHRIRFDRYSVYHQNAQRGGMLLFPIGAMSFVYPVTPADLNGLAYYFATEPGVGPFRYMDDIRKAIENTPGAQLVFSAVRAWRTAHAIAPGPVLEMTDQDGIVEITDTRRCARSATHRLTGLTRAVYLACDAAPRPGKLGEILDRDFGLTAGQDEIADAVGRLQASYLILAVDGRLLSLALKAPLPPVFPGDQFPGGHVYLEPLTADIAR